MFMDPVAEIFDAFDGSPAKLARATRISVQTVCDWRKKGTPNIPWWHRATVLSAIKRSKLAISPATLNYLKSSHRAPIERAA